MKLPAKQVDVLLYLVENARRVVEKDELLSAVWPGRMIEESSLTQTIFLLRRALQEDEGERYIITAPGRGYRFVAETIRVADCGDAVASLGASPAPPQGQAAPASLVPNGHSLSWTYRAFPRLAVIGAVAGLALIAALFLVFRHAPTPEGQAAFSPPPHSVAVLAFTNMSGDPARAFFSDGLSEELINTLSRVDGLQVAARMSAFTFKEGNATVGEIGRKLNVGAVLEGSVRSNGTRLRVTAQLIDSGTGYQFWSRSYDRDSGDVLQLEADIAEAVAQSLQVTLLADEKLKLTSGGTSNALAFDAYLRGSSLIRTFDGPSVRAALAAFEEAIRLDPGFADAHAGRAFGLFNLVWVWPDDPTPYDTEMRQASAEAEKAITLAPRSAHGHAILAYILERRLDLRGAEIEAPRAHTLDSGDVMVERVYARIKAHQGRCREAEAAARHLIALDPLTAAQYYQQAGILETCRKFEDALTALRREQAIGTVNVPRTNEMMAEAHFGLGDFRAALQDCAHSCSDEGLAVVAAADIKLGLISDAKAVFAKLQTNLIDDGATLYAGVYAQWGKPETALHWLDLAWARRDGSLINMRTEIMLDPIRNTPRFLALEQKLGFPPREQNNE